MFPSKNRYLQNLYSRIPLRSVVLSQSMEGVTPPSVFVGRVGYPKVSIGPMMTVEADDPVTVDRPENWSRSTVEDILSFRMQLVRGTHSVGVKENNSFVQNMQEIALAKNSVDIETQFTKVPTGTFINEEVQPYGPTAPIKSVSTGSIKMEKNMEKAYYDTDLLSKNAVINLYGRGIPVSSIKKAFSTGSFGKEKNRKLVPTRWSITAVDDTIGKQLISDIKNYETVGDYSVYECNKLNNRFLILLTPTEWQYEFLEAFVHVFGSEEMLFVDYEGREGRKTYAGMGGCYYSARLAVAEKLKKMKKQAGALVFRESYHGYVPLGVWLIREHVREAMRSQPRNFSDFDSALGYIYSKLLLHPSRYVRQSTLLRQQILKNRTVIIH